MCKSMWCLAYSRHSLMLAVTSERIERGRETITSFSLHFLILKSVPNHLFSPPSKTQANKQTTKASMVKYV